MDALAAGRFSTAVEKGASRFEAWIEHRYGYGRQRAAQLSQAGRVYPLLAEAPPENERQMRRLYRLLRLPDADEVISC